MVNITLLLTLLPAGLVKYILKNVFYLEHLVQNAAPELGSCSRASYAPAWSILTMFLSPPVALPKNQRWSCSLRVLALAPSFFDWPCIMMHVFLWTPIPFKTWKALMMITHVCCSMFCSLCRGWWRVLIYYERKLLLAGWWLLVWCERKILLAGCSEQSVAGIALPSVNKLTY